MQLHLQGVTDGEPHEARTDTHGCVALNHGKERSEEDDEIADELEANPQPPAGTHLWIIGTLVAVHSSLVLHDEAVLDTIGTDVGSTGDGLPKVGENRRASDCVETGQLTSICHINSLQ